MHSFVPQRMLPALALILLTSCSGVSSDPTNTCPPIKKYSREFQKKLASEVNQAPVDAVFPVALQDYAVLRGQIREGCR